MLEVVFSESTKYSIMQAKDYNEKDMQVGAISYFGKKISKAKLKKQLKDGLKGQAIGGNPQDVVNIGVSLDIGNISGGIDSIDRKEIFKKFFLLDPDEKEIEEFFDNQRKDLEKLLTAAKKGVGIRIWKSSAPFSVCGFAFVCYLLKDIDCNISLVTFPDYHHISDDIVLTSASWNSVVPNEFYNFLSFEKELSNIVKQIEANLWEDLTLENAPLRAVVNGKLISVPEDFYDHLILKNIPDGEFIMANLIGKIIGEYELGVGDSWLALRINKMIEENKLEIVSNRKTLNIYDMTLKKKPI